LPSSLTRVLPSILGFSPRLPVSVYGTGTSFLARGFSWQCRIRDFGTIFPSPSQLSLHGGRICLSTGLDCLDAHIHQRALPTFLRPPVAQTERRWYRNINLLSIAYAFRPRLRSRLTLSGRAFLRKPWAFDGEDSHFSFRYSYRHSHFKALHESFRSRFSALRTLPYHCTKGTIHSFGDTFSPGTFSAQSHSTSELLRTL
jgi:hypothetical protein